MKNHDTIIKWIGFGLSHLVEYLYLDTTQTRNANLNWHLELLVSLKINWFLKISNFGKCLGMNYKAFSNYLSKFLWKVVESGFVVLLMISMKILMCSQLLLKLFVGWFLVHCTWSLDTYHFSLGVTLSYMQQLLHTRL